MTLIVMLILAGISLSGLIGEKGLFQRTEDASNRYNEAKSREVLETVLLVDAQFEKNTNPKYNQDEFLDDLIKSEIPGSDVKRDVAIIGEYAYELDRSVPKIGKYLGLEKDLVWPDIDATVKLEDDNKNATIEIKAYAKLWASTTAEVTGIVASVTFNPDGSGEEWKKAHSTIVTINETADKVVKARYVWTRLQTQSGEILKWRSEGFNFDNTGPKITSFTATAVSYSSFKLNITISKTITGITIGNHNCKVIVYDEKNNNSSKSMYGSTKLYTWEKWKYTTPKTYTLTKTSEGEYNLEYYQSYTLEVSNSCTIDQNTSDITSTNRSGYPDNGIKGGFWYVYKGII